jgi:hypothetical protein
MTRRLEIELDNLRAAIALALAGGVDPVMAVKFEVALMRFRTLRGYSREARNNIRAALLLPASWNRTSPVPTRSMSAVRWPSTRATMRKRRRC